MKIKLWMLVSDTDEGTNASAYATEAEAYRMYVTCVFSHLQPDDEDIPIKQKAEAALESGDFSTVFDIVSDYIEDSCDYYVVQEDSIDIPDPLSSRELATVLHALRVVQEARAGIIDGCKDMEESNADDTACDHFNEEEPLNDVEIDALCERINLGADGPLTVHPPSEPAKE